MAADKRLVTYLDIDPVIQYSPSLDDASSTLGWLTSYPSTQNSSFGHPEYPVGVGDSRRTTNSVNASLQFQFYGSSALLYGSAIDIRYNVQVDDLPAQEHAAHGGVLASITDLEPALHTVKVTVLETRGLIFSFDRVEFDIGMRRDWQNSTYPARLGSPGWTYRDDEKWHWTNLTGNWTDGSGRTQDSVFTHAQGAKASLQFKGSAVYIIGNTLPDHGRFKITLESPDKPVTTAIYQGRTKYTTVETLMYFQGGLNSSRMHTLTVENFDNSYLDIVRAIVATGEERHPSRGESKHDVGLIIGGVLGGIACGLALFGIVFFIRHRHKRRKNAFVTAPGTKTDFSGLSKPTTLVYSIPATSYATGSVSGCSDIERPMVQPYLTQPLHGVPVEDVAPVIEEKSLKRMIMLRQQERADRLTEATPPAYSEMPR